MTTWRDVKWEYDIANRRVIAHVGGENIIVCVVPPSYDGKLIGRAIAHAWNVDLAAAQARSLVATLRRG